MHNVFIYDDKIDLGLGQFSSVGGFSLVTEGRNECVEAIREDDAKIYGYIYEVNDGILDMLDTYYGLGVKLHKRISVKAALQGGVTIDVYMYEYNLELV